MRDADAGTGEQRDLLRVDPDAVGGREPPFEGPDRGKVAHGRRAEPLPHHRELPVGFREMRHDGRSETPGEISGAPEGFRTDRIRGVGSQRRCDPGMAGPVGQVFLRAAQPGSGIRGVRDRNVEDPLAGKGAQARRVGGLRHFLFEEESVGEGRRARRDHFPAAQKRSGAHEAG